MSSNEDLDDMSITNIYSLSSATSNGHQKAPIGKPPAEIVATSIRQQKALIGSKAPPEIVDALAKMATASDDAAVQTSSCSSITQMVSSNPAQYQGVTVEAGGDVLAMKAMGAFKSDGESVQIECAKLLAALAHWNLDLATHLGKNGAIDTIAESQRLYPDAYEIGIAATGFADWPDRSGSEANLESIQRTGLLDLVYDNFEKHYKEPEAVLKSLQFFANACRIQDLSAKMVERGYLTKSVQILKDYPHFEGMRGQVAWVNSECFMNPTWMKEQVDAGIIPEMISMLPDAENEKLDLLENSRAIKNAIAILRSLASYSEEIVDTIAENGAIAHLVSAVQKQRYKPDIVVESCMLAQQLAKAEWAIPAVMNHQLRCDFQGTPDERMKAKYVPSTMPWAKRS